MDAVKAKTDTIDWANVTAIKTKTDTINGTDVGDTPADTPVERLMSTPVPLTGSSGDADAQGCGSGCACFPQA